MRTFQPRLLASAARRGSPKPTRDQIRAKQKPWRKWYNLAAWQALRVEVIKRDKDRCQATGVLLTDGRNKPNSRVVDHITPHRGNPKLFFDLNNLRLVSKAWHDREKQKQERADG